MNKGGRPPGPAGTDILFEQLGKAVAARRRGGPGGPDDKIDAIRRWLNPVSRSVYDDPHRFISIRAPRRAAKTVTNVAKAVKVCLENPDARCLLGSMTLKKARQLFWRGKDGLKAFSSRFGLECTFNNAEYVCTFPSGAKIELVGFETAHDIDKVRGEPYDYVGLSECKSFPPDLFDELIDEAITPALADTLGVLLIEGTPGPVPRGTFYLATSEDGCKQKRDGDVVSSVCRPWYERDRDEWQDVQFYWSFHTWTVQDNVAMPHLWAEDLALKRRKGWVDENPIWRREYLGHWVADNSVLVYKYDAERNGWVPLVSEQNRLGLPEGHDWSFGLGCDLGFDNDFAIQVIAWCEDLPAFYQVYEYSAPGLTVGGIAAAITHAREVIGKDFDFLVGDRGGLGKMIFATLESDYGLSIEAADKHEKVTHVELLNGEMIDGRCFIRRGSRLEREMEVLPWAIPKGFEPKEGQPFIRKGEEDGYPKDNCDAFLYCCTRAQHKWARVKAAQPKPGDPEYRKWQREEELRRYFESTRKPKESDTYGRDTTLDGPGSWGGDGWMQ